MRHVLVQVHSSDDRQDVAQLQPQEQPVLQYGSQFPFTVPERMRKGDHARTDGDGARVGTILQLLVFGLIECVLDVIAEDLLGVHGDSILSLKRS